ncbi:stabilization of polarity axis-domain-containing protein, partial [Amanita rubescens]
FKVKVKKICGQDDELRDLVERGYYQEQQPSSDSTFSLGESAVWVATLPGYCDNHAHFRTAITKDTHFYHTIVAYRDHHLPIKLPLSTFPEEVGDYSLITLIKVFSSHQLVSGPQHPHLHTNGPQTHPIIILFNALVTGKSIIFLGHKKPAGDVSSFVLAACALGSGCGVVLRGFIDRAFPYANLENRDEWENVPAYIAGVTNPIFLSSRAWDLLLDIGSGAVTISKDIHTRYPLSNLQIIQSSRFGTLKSDNPIASEDEVARTLKESRADSGTKIDYNADKNFIDDIRAAIEDHFGENLVRMRFTEYVMRFVRLASKYEEETTGVSRIGYPTSTFVDGTTERHTQLGSGIFFSDEASCIRELNANAHRIQAWRTTNSYRYCVIDFARQLSSSSIKGVDVLHQVLRLKNAKNISDAEVYVIMRTLADNTKTYGQVIELLSYLVPYGGGLAHLGFCLFHQRESVREATIQLFNQLRAYPVGVQFLQTLNHFQRYAFVRQAFGREQSGNEDKKANHQKRVTGRAHT